MTISRAELMYEDIIQEYSVISKANGYRTDPVISRVIRLSSAMNKWPEIGIEFGTSEVEIEGWGGDEGELSAVVNEYIPILVVGTVKADMDTDGTGKKLRLALNELVHDLKKVTVALYTKHINDTTGALKWNVVTSTEKPKVRIEEALGLGKDMNVAKAATYFTVKIRNESSDFTG
jgi:hypothetical protein